jgi:hypothetical protein
MGSLLRPWARLDGAVEASCARPRLRLSVSRMTYIRHYEARHEELFDRCGSWPNHRTSEPNRGVTRRRTAQVKPSAMYPRRLCPPDTSGARDPMSEQATSQPTQSMMTEATQRMMTEPMQPQVLHGEMPHGGHLYVQTNEHRNAIIHYLRSPSGEIAEVERVPTGGSGSGVYKSISGQESAPNAFEGAGSVILSPDRRPPVHRCTHCSISLEQGLYQNEPHLAQPAVASARRRT